MGRLGPKLSHTPHLTAQQMMSAFPEEHLHTPSTAHHRQVPHPGSLPTWGQFSTIILTLFNLQSDTTKSTEVGAFR